MRGIHLVDCYLLVHRLDHLLYHLVARHLEVGRGGVESVQDHLYGFGQKVGALPELQEVEAHELVEVLYQLLVVCEVHAVVKSSEFQNDLHDFGLVFAREAVVRLPREYALDALVDHLRTDWVLASVQLRLEVGMLRGHDQECLEVFGLRAALDGF